MTKEAVNYSATVLLPKTTFPMDGGLRSVLLFGLPEKKDPVGSGAYAPDGIVQQAVTRLKETYPELLVVTDVCMPQGC